MAFPRITVAFWALAAARPYRSLEERQAVKECASDTTADPFKEVRAEFSLPSPAVAALEPGVSAHNITLRYGPTFKVLSSPHWYYVLVPCGLPFPSREQAEAVSPYDDSHPWVGNPWLHSVKNVSVPLQMVTGDVDDQGFLEALGVLDRLAKADSASAAPCSLRAVPCSASAAVDADLEELMLYKSWKDIGGALHKAEAVKVYAAFFNKERAAAAFFDRVVEKYNAPRLGVVKVVPVTHFKYDGFDMHYLETVRQTSWQVAKLAAAGAQLVEIKALRDRLLYWRGADKLSYVEIDWYFPDIYALKAKHRNKTFLAEAFFSALEAEGAQAVLEDFRARGKAPAPEQSNIASFRERYGLWPEANYSCLKMVLQTSGQLATGSSHSPYEQDLARRDHEYVRPDLFAEGLARALHKDPSLRGYYWINVAGGERPAYIDGTTCKTPVPICDGSKPVPISLDAAPEDLYAAFDLQYPFAMPGEVEAAAWATTTSTMSAATTLRSEVSAAAGKASMLLLTALLLGREAAVG